MGEGEGEAEAEAEGEGEGHVKGVLGDHSIRALKR